MCSGAESCSILTSLSLLGVVVRVHVVAGEHRIVCPSSKSNVTSDVL